MTRQLVCCLLLLLATGCAHPPEPELKAARAAFADAFVAGAVDYAPSEYQAAKDALRSAEQLYHEGKYEPARELLPFATAQARQATLRAGDEKARLAEEQRKAREAEQERQRRETQAQKPKKKPVPIRTEPPPPPQPKLLDEYQVASEETLRDIAARDDVYADPQLWPLLYKANRDQIKDPRHIYPGQVLTIPRSQSSEELESARAEARNSTLFQTGDQAVRDAEPDRR